MKMILIKNILRFSENLYNEMHIIHNSLKLCFHSHHFHILSMHSLHIFPGRHSNSIMESISRRMSITWTSSHQRQNMRRSHSKILFGKPQLEEYSIMQRKYTIMYFISSHSAPSPIIFHRKNSMIRSMHDGERSIHFELNSPVWHFRTLAQAGHGSSERQMEHSILWIQWMQRLHSLEKILRFWIVIYGNTRTISTTAMHEQNI